MLIAASSARSAIYAGKATKIVHVPSSAPPSQKEIPGVCNTDPEKTLAHQQCLKVATQRTSGKTIQLRKIAVSEYFRDRENSMERISKSLEILTTEW